MREKEDLFQLVIHWRTNIQCFNTRLLKTLAFSGIKGVIMMVPAYKLHHIVVCCIHKAFKKISIYCHYLLKANSALCYGYRLDSSQCCGPTACLFVEVLILFSSHCSFQAFIFHSAHLMALKSQLKNQSHKSNLNSLPLGLMPAGTGYFPLKMRLLVIKSCTMTFQLMWLVWGFLVVVGSHLLFCAGSKRRTVTSVCNKFSALWCLKWKFPRARIKR